MAYTPRPMKDVLADVRKGTGGGARRTTQEQLDESRARAAGRPARPVNPELQAYGKQVVEDRIKRAVMGTISVKGRQPLHVLSHDQFAQFKATGSWEGMPTPEEYGPQHYIPDDKEYT